MENNKNKLVFATSNPNKIVEANKLLKDIKNIVVISKDEYGIKEDIPETGNTIKENAIIKARYVFEKYNISCFAEDTGLEVEALNGEPGIYSARYAGKGRNDIANMEKLLSKLSIHRNKNAQFKTVIAFIDNSGLHTFEGIVKGRITNKPQGDSGFGYDPIFVPDGCDKTFAELGLDVKNRISHRSKAVKKLVDFLNAHYKTE
ncbi:MAG TPA: RdgB/HAM1 family non-canonical purine NTP pyrophosphatase [Bacteroidetes bacterium]|nr:RdgB/HAM1 family non-canonical purine NTP pyrophosphatase [Bacteroidota bacterium]